MKRIVIFLTPILVVLLGVLWLVRDARVAAQSNPRSVFDDFDEVLLKPDPDARWWIRNLNDDTILEEQLCAEDSCIQVQEEDGTSFVEFVLFPDEEPGDYTNAELAELQSGYAYGAKGVWQPQIGQPLSSKRVRWVVNFYRTEAAMRWNQRNLAVNSPPEYATTKFNPQIALGFTWANDENVFGVGLTGMVMIQNFPVLVKAPPFEINMNRWVDLRLEWVTDLAGQQMASFWINDQFIGGGIIPVPISQALSLEMWHDNQAYQISGAIFQNPSREQAFQVDYLRVYQK
jgi:hypothetical protein